MITGTGEGKQFSVTTNQFGSYSTVTHLSPGTHKIEAYFAGDATHTSSSATRVVTVKVWLNPDRGEWNHTRLLIMKQARK